MGVIIREVNCAAIARHQESEIPDRTTQAEVANPWRMKSEGAREKSRRMDPEAPTFRRIRGGASRSSRTFGRASHRPPRSCTSRSPPSSSRTSRRRRPPPHRPQTKRTNKRMPRVARQTTIPRPNPSQKPRSPQCLLLQATELQDPPSMALKYRPGSGTRTMGTVGHDESIRAQLRPVISGSIGAFTRSRRRRRCRAPPVWALCAAAFSPLRILGGGEEGESRERQKLSPANGGGGGVRG